ncbi:hypothetical protein DFJ74DRAFT_759380 [Hyaloraphidium curvatum]|nr:hypothetical protein DFJ74DRAFT_759380 [Hyaloraphidium curvatum]
MARRTAAAWLLSALALSAAFLPPPAAALPVFHAGPGKTRVAAPAPLRAARPPPTPVGQLGLSAYACGADAAQLSCPPGFVLSVESVFVGRDVAQNANITSSCPSGTPDASDFCFLPPAAAAAATLRAAQLCDGNGSCSVPSSADFTALLGDACPGTSKLVRASYSCRSAAVNAPAKAVQPPAGDLLALRSPSTFAAAKCPKYAAGVSGAGAAGAAWIAKSGIPTANLSLTFVDLAFADLDAYVRTATGGTYNLDSLSGLYISAVNVDFGSNQQYRIGGANKGFTAFHVSAINIMSDNSTVDVRSAGPDALGNLGPDVVLKAANMYGTLTITQNGLPAKIEPRSVDVPLTLKDCTAFPESCDFADLDWAAMNNGDGDGTDIGVAGACSSMGNTADFVQAFNYPCQEGDDIFQPVCTVAAPECLAPYGNTTYWNTQVGPPYNCFGINATFRYTDYFGGALASTPRQNSSVTLSLNVDRFIYPAIQHSVFLDNYIPTAVGKYSNFGTLANKVGVFADRQGSPGSQSANVSSAAGIFSTMDWHIELPWYPAQFYSHEYINAKKLPPLGTPQCTGIDPTTGFPCPPTFPWIDLEYSGILDIAANTTRTAKSLMKAICPAVDAPENNNMGFMTGSIVRTSATASPSAFGSADPQVARIIASCADEMVSGGLFSDAQAFLADVSPHLGASDPWAVRAATVLADLRIARKAAYVRSVPFLSADFISQSAGNELSAMQAIETSLAAVQQEGITLAAAEANLNATLAMMDQVVAAAVTEVQGDLNHVNELQTAFDQMNATYAEKYAASQSSAATFSDGVKAALSAEIAEICVEFIMDILTAVATEGAGAMQVFAGLGGKVSQLKNIIQDVDKFAALINTIATMIYNIDSLVNQLIPLVNQIESLPTSPSIDMPPGGVAAAANTTDLASLTQSALSFQILHDQATIYLGPAINQGISGANDYAAALAALADAGLDMVNLQIQLLAAQNKLVQSGVKLQSAQQQRARIADLVASIAGQEAAVGPAVTELSLSLLDRKMRALDLVHQACAAFEYAHTQPCPSAMPDPSSSAAAFTAAANAALTGLNQVFDVSQCLCNISWVTTDPAFIGGLTSSGQGVLDLTNLTDPYINYFFNPWDNVHVYQLNLKPYGVAPTGFTPPGVDPLLNLLVTPSGEFTNTFVSGGVRYQKEFLATPYTFAIGVQPTKNWIVTTPGALTDDASAAFYVPTPFARFTVRADPNAEQQWDFSKVWGVQVEIWAYGSHTSGASTGGAICSTCQTASQAALKAIGAR